jgi:hypothetical protein
MKEVLAAKKDAIVEKWLLRTFQTYPEQTTRFLLREQDPFRNPVARAFSEVLPALFDELTGEMDAAKVSALLTRVVKIRAVQDFAPSRAVAFVFLLKRVLREEFASDNGCPGLGLLEERIDEMALRAFDLFMKCRQDMCDIKIKEARRRLFVLERLHLKAADEQERNGGR